MKQLVGACTLALVLWVGRGHAQVIEFETNGLKYQTLTKSGVTIMFATLPQRLRDYAILQVAVSNGSKSPYVIRPEDFSYERQDGVVLHAAPARVVVGMLDQRGSASDVIKLVTSYENSLSGQNLKSTNGYEQRRQSVLAMGSVRLKAAAAASALAFVQTRLMPGESTDGAVFFPTEANKMMVFGHIVVRTNTDVFNFTTD